MDKDEKTYCKCDCVSDLPTGRRCFMAQAGALALGAAAVTPAVVTAAATILSPLKSGDKKSDDAKSENDSAKSGNWFAVATLDQLPADGAPALFSISDDRQDGWTRQLDVPVGAIFLRRLKDGKVQAFQTICPHAGCPISADEKGFFCSCHAAVFDFDGKRKGVRAKGQDDASAPSPAPRDMDTLETKIENNLVSVNFARFKEGCKEKEEV